MFLIGPVLRPPSRFINRIHRKPLRVYLGVLLMASAFEVLAAPAYLYNISTRCHIQSGTAKAIAGFIIEGGSKTVMIRGFGRGVGFSPNLDVEMTLIRQSDQQIIAYNDDWQDDVRANEIPANQRLPDPTDAGLLVTLPAGAYTAQVEPKGASGIGLVGVNDLDDPETSTSRLINISTRCSVEKSEKNAIAGFIIRGEGKLGVMIRAFGRGLGFSPQLDTTMDLVDLSTNGIVASNDDWQLHANATNIPEKYQLPDSSDAGLLLELSAGAYTAQVKPSGEIGIGLVGVNATDTTVVVQQDKPVYSSYPEPGNTLDFGITSIGIPVTKYVTITEKSDIANLNINIDNLNYPFSINSSQDFTVSSGNSKTVGLECNPTTIGSFNAILRINSNDINYSQSVYRLQCEGYYNYLNIHDKLKPPSYNEWTNIGGINKPEYHASLEPNGTLGFGNTMINVPISKNITIKNNGNADLKINYSSTSHTDFNLKTALPLVISSKRSKILTVQCTPSDEGKHSAKLKFHTNDPDNEEISYTLECIGTSFSEHIVGGKSSSSFAATGKLSIIRDDGTSGICTATLAASDLVLTAAHCVVEKGSTTKLEPENFTFVVGTQSNVKYYPVKKVEIPPNYSPLSDSNFSKGDLAILTLSTPIFDIEPVNLYLDDPEEFEYEKMTIIGYGVSDADKNDHGVRRKTEITISSFTSQFIYSGSAASGSGSCSGDSGGPAFIKLDSDWAQIGVTSFGDKECKMSDYYQRLDTYSNWLIAQGIATEIRTLSCKKDNICDGQCETDSDCWKMTCPSGSCTAKPNQCVEDYFCDSRCDSDPDCQPKIDYPMLTITKTIQRGTKWEN